MRNTVVWLITHQKINRAIFHATAACVLTVSSSGCGLLLTAVPTSSSVIRNKPVQVHQAAGSICALLDSGVTKCWGSNQYGQLLTGTAYVGARLDQMGDNLVAVDFGTGRSAKAVGTMSWTMCAILDNDTVKCWGRLNTSGVLGYGDLVVRSFTTSETVALGTGKVPVEIVGGYYFVCARFTDGSVKCWGDNAHGQLGQGDTAARGSGANQMGDNLSVINLGTGKTAKAIAAGSYHACAILNDDTVKCWGNGGNGRLGYGDAGNRGSAAGQMGDSLPAVDLGTGRTAKHITLGAHQTCAHLDNDQVKCWGTNASGRLGLGDTTDRGSAAGQMGDNLPYVNLGTGRSVKSVMYSGTTACAILDNNALKCWGYNGYGTVGLGDLNDRGDVAGEMGDNLPTVDLGTGLYPVALAGQSNSGHFCALLNNGKMKCWGFNLYANLGQGTLASLGDGPGEMGDNLPPINLGIGKTATAITVTTYTSCGLLSDSTFRCWGTNDGTLGKKNIELGNDPNEIGAALPIMDFGQNLTVKTIAPSYTSCALFTNGSAKCWGYNIFGTIGQGNTANVGGAYGETGDALPFINFGTGRTATKLFNQGGLHICALLDDGSLKCWGQNTNGNLGLGDTNHRGDAANEMGDNLPTVDLGTGKTLVDMVTGYFHSCALLNDSTVKCWGGNAYGQLGYGSTTSVGTAAGQMGNSLAAVNLGTGRTAKTVTCGTHHSCAILDNDSVKCWGWNAYGQLGLGDTSDRGSAAGQMGDNLPAVNLGTGRIAKSIYAGDLFTCALLDNNSLKCWGRNEYGQLGQGDLVSRGVGPAEMGDQLPPIDVGTGRTIKNVVLGAISRGVCVVLDDDSLKCWGNGGLGIPATGNRNHIGDAPGEMGDHLPTVDLGSH